MEECVPEATALFKYIRGAFCEFISEKLKIAEPLTV